MRLDKFLSETGTLSRSESGRAVRAGKVLVNGRAAKSPSEQVDPERDVISYGGETIRYRRFTYILLNKPDGYVSATEDGREKTVLELLPEKLQKMSLFPCGRLDKHTLGLMLLTNDGQLAHDLLSPRHHVAKKYRFSVKFPLTAEEINQLEKGTVLDDGYETKPSVIEADPDGRGGVITLIEGKYHQIKRMMESVHNQITALERITFGPLSLDESLARGEWRYLTEEEESALHTYQTHR
ncbi:MAG: rRNA pseudouridine synthase [Clostridia bacterium]|nr:rRNA pseudouridine synthase [Clostridia bacterium]